jgi:pimeloyl-ACP methyl ester carboxylesterase
MKTIRKYGTPPYLIGLLHGGPGALGAMKPLAEKLSSDFGVLELLQTEKTVNSQIEELYRQLISETDYPVVLTGHSWGAWLGFLFACKYPGMVKKLILIGAGAFENKYNSDLLNIRLNRSNEKDKVEIIRLLSLINSGNSDNETLKRFGELMTIADSYDYEPVKNEIIDFNMNVFQSVWQDASELRDKNLLLQNSKNIKCPVVAIHGDYDPHPYFGVEKPLSDYLTDFKMIKIENCGHTPWKERYAKDVFYEILLNEIYSRDGIPR